mgnify:FL=1
MSNLVNAFGKISLDETARDTRELLEAILVELKIMNLHMSQLDDEEITAEDVDRYGE